MLSLRFLVIDRDNVVLGGNQRLRACQEAGIEKVPVVKAEDLNSKQLKEFVIKDNLYFGEFDKILLAQNYSESDLIEVGMDLVELSNENLETIGDTDQSDIEKRKQVFDNNDIKQIVCYFSADLYEKVCNSMELIKEHMRVKETPEILLNLLTYWKQNYER